MKSQLLRNDDGSLAVFVEKTFHRGGEFSGVVAELITVDGGVVITRGASREPVACRGNMDRALEYVKRKMI